ncbi:hypothetical protein Hypma_007565 [Hypsizygus marmoreus]|uniref:Uncharacterized protein n=1 Tax=Hypsizygus marmoreus TaxID=39966 RepID=A0A369JSQ1_HYPMA|nr:hypothetical protein Hypma_007565 [Hypsizygus marmoreus]
MGRKRKSVLTLLENLKGRVQSAFKKPRVDNAPGKENAPETLNKSASNRKKSKFGQTKAATKPGHAENQPSDYMDVEMKETSYPGMSSFQCSVPDTTAPISQLSQYYHYEFCVDDLMKRVNSVASNHSDHHEFYTPDGLADFEDEEDDGDYSHDVINDVNVDGEDDEVESAMGQRTGTAATPTIDASTRPGKLREAPTQLMASLALKDLQDLLQIPRKTGRGYRDPGLDVFVRMRMEGMRTMLNFFTNPRSATYNQWGASSCQASISLGKGRYCARQLRKLTRQFIDDRTVLPVNPFGDWNQSMLVDEDLVNDINLYLQELGKEISAQKLVDYLARDDVRAKHGITRSISERTARHYLNTLGYRWASPKKGQYADGHEREDVVFYRNNKFLPQWREIQSRMRNWTTENLPEFGPMLPGRIVIVWFHDESIFYAHDRRKKAWYHKDAPAKPYVKGEGASLMIADFVSADFGWLQSPDGTRSARRVMRPGKNKDGYFTSADIQDQVNEAMDIVSEFYPEYEHVFVYDNASTHLKRAEDSLSARRMPKYTPPLGKNWKIDVTKRDATGKPKYNADGSLVKIKIPMGNGRFSDGTPQSMYFEEGHPRAGVFKGMMRILEERGFGDTSKLLAECPKFKCAPPALDCCCRRILYNEPDFTHVEWLLEKTCQARGFRVIFLPKFHCELNFIEQCWGYAKRIYRLNPDSSREDVLERNALAALDAVPLESMRRFANRSRQFMDAYDKGLNGRQAAWAARKYRGHRVLPESIMNDLEKANVN